MFRLFDTHKVRYTKELSESLWDFCTCPEEGEGVKLRVLVPSCFETYPETLSYRGRACYRRSFTAGGNIRLEFKGVSHTAEVFVDGCKVMEHYNAYTPFSTVIKNLSEGEHELKVNVSNAFGEQSALHVPNDYQSYGGISRAVILERLKDVYIKSFHVTPVLRGDVWCADLSVKAENLSETPFCGKLHIFLDGKQLVSEPVQIMGNKEAEILFTAVECEGVNSWSEESPALYTAQALLTDEKGNETDDLIDRIGFREVKVCGREILMNGRPLRIRGFCRHEDHPQFGCSLPLSAMQQDLMIMKDLGANSVRTSHYPNDELFLDLCDELGILVWEENHARGLSEEQMRNPNFMRQCEDCIREMIEAHYNHPSIYIWGILNECASNTEYGKDCYQKQFAQIRTLDKSRPRSFASCHFKSDICFGLPEVVSYNIYPQWYHDTPAKEYLEDLYQWVQDETEGSGKPFLITETGAGAIYGYRTPAKVKWSEDYQAEALRKQISAVFEKEGCSGIYIWQFCDCRVCESCFGGRPRTMNNKGIVDEYRRPKLSYEVVKELFHQDKNR